MRILKTKQDFDVLRHSGNLRATLLDQIEAYFLQLKDELEGEVENEFCLHGYIVVLEAGDNIRDLGNVRLNRENCGLLGSCPEYVELFDVGESLQAYKVAVLYDNDYLMTFFTQVGAHYEEVEQWLKDQAERSCRTLSRHRFQHIKSESSCGHPTHKQDRTRTLTVLTFF